MQVVSGKTSGLDKTFPFSRGSSQLQRGAEFCLKSPLSAVWRSKSFFAEGGSMWHFKASTVVTYSGNEFSNHHIFRWLLSIAYWFRTKSELWPFRISCPEFPYQHQLPLILLLLFSLSAVSDSLDPMDYSPPGSIVHRILQAKTLEWVAISFPRGSSQARNRTCLCCISCIDGRVLCHWATCCHPDASYSHRAKAGSPLGQCTCVMGISTPEPGTRHQSRSYLTYMAAISYHTVSAGLSAVFLDHL